MHLNPSLNITLTVVNRVPARIGPLRYSARGLPQLAINDSSRTVRALEPDADTFYGLSPGTNGSGPAMRRQGIAPEGYAWLCSNGRPALGLCSVPSAHSWAVNANPWNGHP